MNQQFLQTKDGQKLQVRFLELREKLSALEWITHGSVTPNHPGNWKWTTKVKAKTVTLSLTQEQADLFKEAIAANREAESILVRGHLKCTTRGHFKMHHFSTV